MANKPAILTRASGDGPSRASFGGICPVTGGSDGGAFMSEFERGVALLLLDKGVLAGIAFTLWHFYSGVQQRREASFRQMAQLADEVRQLQRDRRRTEIGEEIALLERQLTDFLWPMQYFLHKDGALWERVPQLSNLATLPDETGRALELEAVIPNHEAALATIEKHFGLIADNPELADEIIRYVRHVAVYRALRSSNQHANPIDVGEPFPKELPDLIRQATATTRQRLNELRAQRFEGRSAPGLGATAAGHGRAGETSNAAS
jgi:hypothetical protein